MKKVRASSTKDGWYEITPGDAQQLLDSQGANRPLTASNAQALARVIENGDWAENGEALIFDEDGKLMDGQHRLRGCVLANKSIISYCVFDIPRRFFSTLDDGRKRTGADTLAIAGVKHAAITSAIARICVICESGSVAGFGRSVPNKITQAYVKKHKDVEKSAAFVSNIKDINAIVAPALVGYVHLMAARHNPRKADEFVEKLVSGEGLAAGDPILLLRNRLISIRAGDANRITRYMKLALMAKAWNLFVAGKKVGTLKWLPRKEGSLVTMRFDGESE